MATPEQRHALMVIASSILDTVKDMGEEGAPGGSLYAAVMEHIGLDGFQSIMGVLVERGYLRKDGQLYYYTRDEDQA